MDILTQISIYNLSYHPFIMKALQTYKVNFVSLNYCILYVLQHGTNLGVGNK